MKKFLILVGVAVLATVIFITLHSLSTEKPIPTTPISNNLEIRGKQLRLAIDQTYKKMSDMHTITTMGENDISPVIMQYIPLGTSFDDADQILRGAGFKIFPRPGLNPPRILAYGGKYDATRYDEAALIDPYIASKWFGAKIDISVGLTPPAPGDYSRVLKIHARISVTTL